MTKKGQMCTKNQHVSILALRIDNKDRDKHFWSILIQSANSSPVYLNTELSIKISSLYTCTTRVLYN